MSRGPAARGGGVQIEEESPAATAAGVLRGKWRRQLKTVKLWALSQRWVATLAA